MWTTLFPEGKNAIRAEDLLTMLATELISGEIEPVCICLVFKFSFSCDWHRYNLRRKMKTLPVVTESEYALLSTAEKNLTVDDR